MHEFIITIVKILQDRNASVKHQNSTACNFTSLLGEISVKYCSIFNSTYTRDHILLLAAGSHKSFKTNIYTPMKECWLLTFHLHKSGQINSSVYVTWKHVTAAS